MKQKLLRILPVAILLCLTYIGNAQPPGNGWSVVFADEFNGNSLNQNTWRPRTNGVFKTEQIQVNNGTLKLKNTYTNAGVIKGGWIQTRQGFSGNNKYGYYEARIRVSWNSNGDIWPTWWIWGGKPNGTSTTEIDVMEYSGFAPRWFNNKATSSHHYRGKRQINGKSHITTTYASAQQRNAFQWHRWGVLWTPNELSFWYDGVKYMTSDQPGDAALENNPMNLIFSTSPHTINADPEQPDNPIAANAAKPGENFPNFEIDWVRVWRGGNPYPGGGGGNQIVSLQCVANSKYVSSENGAGPMNCNRNAAGAWEKFEWIDTGNGTALKNLGKHISSENGNGPMNCNRNSIGAWERFTVQHQGNQVYAFLCSNGKYMTGSSPMRCDGNGIGNLQKFKVSWGLSARQAPSTASSPINEVTEISKETNVQLNVYPNPAQNYLMVNVDGSEEKQASLTVFTMDGLAILKKLIPTNIDNKIDFSNLSKGIYFVKVGDAEPKKIILK